MAQTHCWEHLHAPFRRSRRLNSEPPCPVKPEKAEPSLPSARKLRSHIDGGNSRVTFESAWSKSASVPVTRVTSESALGNSDSVPASPTKGRASLRPQPPKHTLNKGRPSLRCSLSRNRASLGRGRKSLKKCGLVTLPNIGSGPAGYQDVAVLDEKHKKEVEWWKEGPEARLCEEELNLQTTLLAGAALNKAHKVTGVEEWDPNALNSQASRVQRRLKRLESLQGKLASPADCNYQVHLSVFDL